MNGYLRQATASQVRTIGAFIDDTDFKTLENALTINNTDIVISINGGADTVKNSGGATAHGAGGIYTLTWDATDTASIGELSFSVKVAGALVVFGTYVVLDEAVYDALFGTVALATATNITAGTITTATNVTTVNGLAAGVITAASIAADAITDAKVASDVTIASVTGAVGSVTGAVGSVTGNVGGNVTGSVGSVVGAVGSVTGAVGSVTGNVGGNVVGSVASVLGAVGSVTAGVTLSTSTMTEAYAADGAAMSAPQALYMIWSKMAEMSISGTTLTAKKLDGSTTAMTFTLDDATTPAAITRAT